MRFLRPGAPPAPNALSVLRAQDEPSLVIFMQGQLPSVTFTSAT